MYKNTPIINEPPNTTPPRNFSGNISDFNRRNNLVELPAIELGKYAGLEDNIIANVHTSRLLKHSEGRREQSGKTTTTYL